MHNNCIVICIITLHLVVHLLKFHKTYIAVTLVLKYRNIKMAAKIISVTQNYQLLYTVYQFCFSKDHTQKIIYLKKEEIPPLNRHFLNGQS